MPRVSVVIPSYNHERFVGECLESVLSQTYQDFEIVITDDGSTDHTISRVREYQDPRLRLFIHPENRGACSAMNNCIENAVGEFVAVMNSDDAWESTKLEKQVAFLDSHPEFGGVFTKAAFVDDNGAHVSPFKYKFYSVFEVENRSRYEWLRHFFRMGNCLCHPSALIKAECYRRIGPYDKRMASIPDLDMWVRLCLEYSIHILDEKLVRFRIRANEANVSGDKPETQLRWRFEYKQILDHYLKIRDTSTFLQVFPEAAPDGQVDRESIPFLLALQAISVATPSVQLWGLELLYRLLGDPSSANAIERDQDFRFTDFHRLTGSCDAFSALATRRHPPPINLAQVLRRWIKAFVP